MSHRGRPPLVVWTTLVVLAAALLPMAISVFQLRSNGQALLDQVQRTHLVATTSVAARLDSHLGRLVTQTATLAAHPVLRSAPQSAEAQNLLRSTLQAEADLVAVAAYDQGGELLVLAQRRDATEALGEVIATPAPEDASSVRLSASRRWLGFSETLEAGAVLVAVADAAPAVAVTVAPELGDTARLALVDGAGAVLAGDSSLATRLDPNVLQSAINGNLAGGAGVDRRPDGHDLVFAHAPLSIADWFVLSYQPAEAAELARAGIRRATTVGVIGAVLLSLAFATMLYTALIKPLRRIVHTQRELAGATDQPAKGSELDQLETSLALLSERLQDRQALDEVFLGRYQVLDLAGTGSSSSVFRGWDPKLERPVALKTIRLDRQEDAVGTSERRDRQTDRLLGEAVTHARFVHPNIVTLYDVVDTGRAAFIAMELVDGCSLDAYLKLYAPLATDQIVALGIAIARGLEVAHGDDLVHQDIKPGNILLGEDGSVKVADFGIAQLTPMAAQSDESISGTPGYLAPESLEGKGYNQRSDLFALGVVLYEAATAKHPFRSRKRTETFLRTLEANPPRADAMRPRLLAGLADLIQKLLSKRPEARSANAAQVAADLEALVAPREVSWQPDPLPRRRSQSATSSRVTRSWQASASASTETGNTQVAVIKAARHRSGEASDQNST